MNGNAIVGNTFEMPAADVVVNAVLLERYYTFNNTTGELALIFGAFNKDDMWGWDPMAVTSVTATNEVSFTGSCFNMFCFYINCTSMDLSNVNTDNVTNMTSMFSMCFNLTTIEGISGWNTANVTDMSYMFYDCEILTTLDLSCNVNLTELSCSQNKLTSINLSKNTFLSIIETLERIMTKMCLKKFLGLDIVMKLSANLLRSISIIL